MTLQDLGALGELLGGIAVVVTLVYLALQVRQNTAMMTAQAVQSSIDATQRVLLFRAENPEIRRVLQKARTQENLTVDEIEALASYLQAVFMNFQGRLQHNLRGVFDTSVNESYELILVDYFRQPFVRRWWEFSQVLYGASFRRHCNDILRAIDEGTAAEPLDWSSFAGVGRNRTS